MDSGLKAAIAALDAGDVEGLDEMLAADPDLVHRRVETTDEPYAGYFASATLLHHVAGNPVRGEMPGNAPELARLLLARGADVDAECGGGPTQPDSKGTTLGLVTSSGPAAERGLSKELIDVLMEAGADPDQGNGGCLFAALYHTVECRLQRDVARMLYARGAEVDLGYAAGLGDVERMASFFQGDGELGSDAYCKFRTTMLEDPAREEVLLDALVFACANGREEAAAFLLEKGAPINVFQKFGPWEVTPLHAAAWAGWPDMVSLLVERGADLNVRDPEHDGAPPGWAAYCKRPETVERFLEYADRFDLRNAVELGQVERFEQLFGDGDPNMALGPGGPGVLLRAAAAMGHVELVRTLLERGADPKLANHQGLTALDFAREAGRDEIVALLSS